MNHPTEYRTGKIHVLLLEAHKLKYPERYAKPEGGGILLPEAAKSDPIFDALIEAIKLAAPNPFADARHTMAAEFLDQTPGSVYHTYFCSITVLLRDTTRMEQENCDRLAHKLMHLIFQS